MSHKPPALPPALAKLKVSIAHDWLTGMRGGEKALQALLQIFPQSPLYTLVCAPDTVSAFIRRRRLTTSLIQRLPAAAKFYRNYLPLFPLAVSAMRVKDCDLLISSSSCAVKALRSPGLHISYIHSPMRYIWEQYDSYYQQATPLKRLGMRLFSPWLRNWDIAACARVDAFIANSANVRARIERHYRRPALVVYPPVDLSRFAPQPGPKDYYLLVSAMVPYKRLDLAIMACNKMKLPLKVVGTGPEQARLRALAGPQTEFLGWQDNVRLARLYAGAKALIFPGEEDFGITPLEAMASGCPVLAYGRGGALETVLGQDSPTPTGRFFLRQNIESLCQGLRDLQRDLPHFDRNHLTAQAAKFATPVFQQNIIAALLASI
jgi:glycosyltransferase involved in cell wall biosynthesis